MNKLKKLSKFKKHKKPILVFIYGAPAVGKYTTAQKLAKITGFKLLHSHSIKDLIFDFFDFNENNIHGREIWESFYLNFTERIMKEKINVIFTHSHARNRIYCIGFSSLKFVEKVAKVVKKSGGIFYPVHLVCEDKELFKRVGLPSRKKFGKSHTIKRLKLLLKTRDYGTPLLMKNNFNINNTRISATRTAKIIKDHFNL